MAAQHFDAELAMPNVYLDLRRISAGQVRVTDQGDCLIRYNAHLLERHLQAFLSQTIPHETVHLVALSLFEPRVPLPHEREWRAIMTLLRSF